MGSASSVPEGTLEADTVETALIKGMESAVSQAINSSVAAHPEWRQAPPAVSELLQLIADGVLVTAKAAATAETRLWYPRGVTRNKGLCRRNNKECIPSCLLL